MDNIPAYLKKLLRDQACRQQHLLKSFFNKDHCSFVENVTITFIEIDPNGLKCREHYWGHTPKAMTLLGLNMENI